MKKFLIFTLAIFLVGIFVSCDEQTTDSVAVGDIILNDGSYFTAETYSEDEYDSDNKPIGIVAFIGDGTVGEKGVAYIMGLNFGSDLTWVGVTKNDDGTTTTKGNGITTNFENIYCTPSTQSASTATFTGDTDGSDNFAKIKNITEVESGDYPIFEYAESYTAEDYTTGWYIPTVAEISYLFKNLNAIQKTITAINDLKLSDIETPSFSDTTEGTSTPKTFWTSSIPYAILVSKTQALCVTFNSSGDIESDTKTNAHSALVIHKFE